MPVAGADRLALSDHIAVQDLVALGRAMLLPEDDLNFACLLKSPLVGLDERALFDLAWNRGSAGLLERLRAAAKSESGGLAPPMSGSPAGSSESISRRRSSSMPGCWARMAAGLADAALGSDSGGSIRIPAACCGVTGFKPTWGLVPAEGCFPLAPSYDHVGPMARDVEGCEQMLQALAPGFEPTELALEDVEVGVAWTELADPLVRGQVEAAAERFPNRRRLELPLAEGFYDSFSREVADVHRELFAEHADSYGETVRPKIERCLAVTDADTSARAKGVSSTARRWPRPRTGSIWC